MLRLRSGDERVAIDSLQPCWKMSCCVCNHLAQELEHLTLELPVAMPLALEAREAAPLGKLRATSILFE